MVLVEGLRAVEEALDAGARASFAVTSTRLRSGEVGRTLLARLGEATRVGPNPGPIDVVELGDTELDGLAATESPQAVLLVCREPVAGLDDLTYDRPVLVLDAIQDPGNVGTLIRSAVAFGMTGIVTLDGTADPWGAKAVRASAGMAFRLPIVRCDVDAALSAFAENKVQVLVAAASAGAAAETSLAVRSGPRVRRRDVALFLGNEGSGVRDKVRAAAHGTVSVEMSGPAESLNVGVAGSILMHDLTRESE